MSLIMLEVYEVARFFAPPILGEFSDFFAIFWEFSGRWTTSAPA